MKNTFDLLGFNDFQKKDLEKLQGFGLNSKDRLYKDCRSRVNYHLPILSQILNDEFSTSFSNKFWRICFGHWISSAFQLIIFRFNIFLKLKGEPNIQTIFLEDFKEVIEHISLDSTGDFPYLVFNEEWNVSLTSYMQKIMFSSDTKIPKIYEKEILHNHSHEITKKDIIKIRNFGKSFFYKKRFVIYKSYLNKKINFLLQMSLGLIPKSSSFPKAISKNCVDLEIRQRIIEKWLQKSRDDLDKIIIIMCVSLFPKVFLEYFTENLHHLNGTELGNNDVLFSSNGFDQDDLFVLFTALSSENGAKIFVGQHGNNWTSSRHYLHQDEIEETADLFISWGSEGLNSKSKEAFIFKSPKKIIKPKNDGPIMVILHRPPSPFYLWDRQYEFIEYDNNIDLILNYISNQLKRDVILRCHVNHEKFGGKTKEYYKKKYPRIEIDDGKYPINKIKKRCSLIIETYHTTGMLENFSQDFPVITFWSCGWELNDRAEAIYEHIRKAGLLHNNIEKFFNEIKVAVNNTEKWWSTDNKIKAKEIFVSHYAKLERFPLFRLRKILTNLI